MKTLALLVLLLAAPAYACEIMVMVGSPINPDGKPSAVDAAGNPISWYEAGGFNFEWDAEVVDPGKAWKALGYKPGPWCDSGNWEALKAEAYRHVCEEGNPNYAACANETCVVKRLAGHWNKDGTKCRATGSVLAPDRGGKRLEPW